MYEQENGQPVENGRPLLGSDSIQTSIQVEQPELDASIVKWVDSRPISGNQRKIPSHIPSY